jgi:hypothetical protein
VLLALACSSPSSPTPARPSFLSALEEGPAPYVGAVEERLEAGGYHYTRLSTPDGPRWVVSVLAPPPGEHLSVRPLGHLDEFRSPAAGRRFAPLDFTVSTSEAP